MGRVRLVRWRLWGSPGFMEFAPAGADRWPSPRRRPETRVAGVTTVTGTEQPPVAARRLGLARAAAGRARKGRGLPASGAPGGRRLPAAGNSRRRRLPAAESRGGPGLPAARGAAAVRWRRWRRGRLRRGRRRSRTRGRPRPGSGSGACSPGGALTTVLRVPFERFRSGWAKGSQLLKLPTRDTAPGGSFAGRAKVTRTEPSRTGFETLII